MDAYLISLGGWNFLGSLFMIGFFNETFGKKVLNTSTRIFVREFRLDYWIKFWLGWAIGLNIFYGAVNIAAAYWATVEMKVLIILFDLLAYSTFMALAIWGKRTGNCGSGIYSVFVIFGIWIGWGIFTFMYK